VRTQLRQIDKAIEAAYNTADDATAGEEARVAALEEVDRLRVEAKGLREGPLVEREGEVRAAESRLEASVGVQRAAAEVVEGLLVQRVYMARRMDGDGKKLLDGARAEANAAKEGVLRLKTLVATYAIKAGAVAPGDVDKELGPIIALVREGLAFFS
jgi:hypothetical protein